MERGRDTPADALPASETGRADRDDRGGRTGRERRKRGTNGKKSASRSKSAQSRSRRSASRAQPSARGPRRSAQAIDVLCRSTDSERGFRRVRTAKGFEYLNRRGQPITDERVLARIASLVVPPAWEDVWICADPSGHLQATGRDARGRKQYRYHPLWREHREGKKFARIADFARALPRVRKRVERDLARGGLPREKVIAAIVRLLDLSLARIGGMEYARDNATYGLTTLRKRHLRLGARSLMLNFNGKSGVLHEITVKDAHVRRVVCACRRLPGAVLFACREGGEARRISADDVNRYLRDAAGCAITAKDFRVWGASVAALARLREVEPPNSQRAEKVAIAATIREVSSLLRNTPAVCRRSYVHPAVLEAWRSRALTDLKFSRANGSMTPAERAFTALLCGGE